MRTIPTAMMAAALAFAVAAPATAGRILRREHRQDRRIEAGERSGRLTPKEAGKLEEEQRDVAHERAEAMEDGHISRRERKELRHDQNRASHDIRRKKHNRRHD